MGQSMCVCVCVRACECVSEREMRERERGRHLDSRLSPYDQSHCGTAGSQVATLQVSGKENAYPSGQEV